MLFLKFFFLFSNCMPYLQLIRSNYKSSIIIKVLLYYSTKFYYSKVLQSNKTDKKTETERQLDFHHKT